VKYVEFRCPLAKIIAVLADHVAKDGKNDSGASPHIIIKREVLRVPYDIVDDLLYDTIAGIIIKKYPDRDPADRSKNTKQKSADRKQS
jgi:hypothetical protein